MKKLQLMIFAFLCMLIVATSCSVGDSGSNPDQGQFLMANISPDAPPLSVNINGSAFGAGLFYGNYTPYYIATAGSYQFAFYGTASTPALSNTVNIEVSKRYSYFVIDSFSKLKSSFVEDKLIQPGPDSTYVRFFNFSPNAGAINLVDSASNMNLYSARSFNDEAGNSLYSEFTRVKSGIYTFKITTPDGGTVMATRKDTLLGGRIYSLFAKGFVGGTGGKELGLGQILHF